jgi:hypothetical protein
MISSTVSVTSPFILKSPPEATLSTALFRPS